MADLRAFKPERTGPALLIIGAAVLALPPLLAVLPGVVPCVFRELTGLPCPFCGLTRALIAIMHGQVLAGLAMYPLSGVIVAAGLLLVPTGAVVLVSGRGVFFERLVNSRPAARTGLLLLAANWVYLLINPPF